MDLVIPYVDGSDRQWIRDYIRTTGMHNPSPERFRSWGTLKYLFRGVEKYLPFIDRIVLLVARESQVPAWVNEKTVKVVYHREFIPNQFLPTFNSGTIESYLWNIPDISELFLYANDDMFPINLMSKDEFFTPEGKPILSFEVNKDYKTSDIWRCELRTGLDMIADSLGKERYPQHDIIKPKHNIAAMRKSTLDAVGELCKDQIAKSISCIRKKQNVTQYIYSYYEYYTDGYAKGNYSFVYLRTHSDLKTIIDTILDSDYQLVCINDSGSVKDYPRTRYLLQQCFEKKFPVKSKYEL